jgi:hypothetical protein
MRKLSRLEANKEVRRVLNRHGADLSYTQYSVAGKDVRLTGWLCKIDSSEFSAGQIETMVLEFRRILPGYSISGECDNWNFAVDHVTYLGNRSGKDEDERILFMETTTEFDSEAS